jgi:hypothetical protein
MEIASDPGKGTKVNVYLPEERLLPRLPGG